ncbi:sensor histidine kinase [Nesterenkonia flava]|uniref:histidine kinase n=1 Tax=Nesterenkonia flava TaxID=469799 RepID=A0ABU1FXC3_9MICC|nr:histidine kinase [Nesterenkonia flava]MDR5712811.1 histidine kinase [Nesterenkonia flava]
MPDRRLSRSSPTGYGLDAQPLHVRIVKFFEERLWLGDLLFKVLPLLFFIGIFWGLSGVEWGLLNHPVNPRVMFVLELMGILPLIISRIRPGLAAGLMTFACLCQVISLQGPGFAAFAVPFVIYACAKYGSRRVSRTYLGIGLLGALLMGGEVLVLSYAYRGAAPYYAMDWVYGVFITVLVTGFCAAVVLVAWLLGDLAGRRRREVAAVQEKNRLLQRERDQEAQLAADAERMRIAREMHDVISHSMSVMIAQADGGRYVLEADPQRAAHAFETISDTGREALTEMRRMLGVLREDQDHLKMKPAPGVEDLPGLVEDVRASGVDVSLHIAHHHLPPLSEGVSLAIYRIVQEALTNTMKHAGPGAVAEVWLGVDLAAAELALEIRDTGAGASAADDGAGSGLLGMAERARLYGGRVLARPKGEESLESGFVVEARFPLARVSPTGSQPGASRGAGARVRSSSE